MSRQEPNRGRGRRRTPSALSPELLAATRALWEPRYGRQLSDEEARQILANMLGFCHALLARDTAARGAVEEAA